MASQTFPKAQNAIFSGPSGSHKYHTVNLHESQAVYNVTGSGDTHVVLINGYPISDVSAIGSIISGGFGLSQSAQITLGTVVLKPYDWTVGKRWTLTDVTGSGDSEKNWSWGWPVIYGSIRGWVTSGGPIYATQTVALSAAFDLFGTVSGTVNIRKLLVGAPIRTGGPMPISFQFQASGEVDHDDGIAPLMDTETTFDPPKGTLDLTLDTGEAISHAALCYDYSVRATANAGGPEVLNAKFRFDAATV